MEKIYLATHNKHKVQEFGQILTDFEVVADGAPDVEENAPDFAGNALVKVRSIASRHPGEWCMADDSGLEVAALGGEPGVRSARYSEDESPAAAEADRPRLNNEKLLAKLSGVANRAANFTCVIALVDPQGREHLAEGRCFGRIAEAPSGAGGFGYDPLFVPDGHDRTFAELPPAVKNAESHRARAVAEAVKIIAGQQAR